MGRVQGTKKSGLKDRKEYYSQWYVDNRDTILAYQKEYYLANKEKCRAYHKDWYEKNKARVIKRQRKKKLFDNYGLSEEALNSLYELQNHKCAICGADEGWRGKLVIDHCHTTGTVRGLLCDRCNLCIGSCNDDVTLLEAMIFYLDKRNG